MKQNLNNNYSQTLTCVEEKFIKKTHEKLYLVLKKKGFAEQIIEKIGEASEKRLKEFLMKILTKLNEMHFDNPEEALETLILKQMVKILDDMFKERLLLLSENDKKLLFENLEKKDDVEEKKEKNK